MNLIHPASRAPSKQTKRKRLLIIGLLVLVLLVIIRLALPYIVLNFINNRLANIHGYFGHVDDLDISLYRGAYIVKDIYIDIIDTTTQNQLPFFSADNVDISIEWKSLLKGQIVSELECHTALLRFTNNASEPEQLERDSNDFRLILKTFTPLKVNRFEVFNGKIQYLDQFATPPVDIFLDNAHVLANNLSNVEDTTLLPATIVATADVYEGKMTFNMRINALANDPTYDLNAEIKNANLVRLNTFFKAYGDFDINRGVLDVYLELAAKDRKYIGYVKPVIKDLDVVGPEDRKDSVLRKLWEGIVGIAGDIAKNPQSDKIATKVPIVGEYGERTIGIWYAVLATVRNAFIQAIYPSLDHQVNIGLVKAVDAKEGNKGGLFKKAFDGPLKKEEREEKKKD
ncbi:MAG: DUF748 domain-containing protein [Saprospiraceae bacterium]|nr:DUF748 domain-containing protein [Saprospiraceae bacterium]